MEQMVFAIFMMGCGHNLDVCRPIDAPQPLYETEASCQQEMNHVARHVTGFPNSVGTCVAVPADQVEENLIFEWHFAADGRLLVDVVIEPLTLAQN